MNIWLFGDSHTNGWSEDFTALASAHTVTNFGSNGSNSHHWQNGIVPGQEQHPGEGLLDQAFAEHLGVVPDLVVYSVGLNDAVFHSWLPDHEDAPYYAPELVAARNRANIDRILNVYGVPRVIVGRQGVAMEVEPGTPHEAANNDGLCKINIDLYHQWEIQRHWPEQQADQWEKEISSYIWGTLPTEEQENASDLARTLWLIHHNPTGKTAIAGRVLNAL